MVKLFHGKFWAASTEICNLQKKKKKKKEESVLLGDRNRHIPMARDVPSSCFIPQTKGGLHYDYEYRFGAKFYC